MIGQIFKQEKLNSLLGWGELSLIILHHHGVDVFWSAEELQSIWRHQLCQQLFLLTHQCTLEPDASDQVFSIGRCHFWLTYQYAIYPSQCGCLLVSVRVAIHFETSTVSDVSRQLFLLTHQCNAPWNQCTWNQVARFSQDWRCHFLVDLGKPHWESCRVYSGIAQMGGGGSKRLPGWFGALI